MKLGDICNKGKSSLRQKDLDNQGTYPVFGASGISGYLESYQNSVPYIAIIKDGAGVGRVSLCDANTSVLGTMQAIIPKSYVIRKYLFHLLKSMKLGSGFSGSTIPHIYFKDYSKRKVYLPDLETQEEIAELLDLVEHQIKLYMGQITRCHALVKSRFIEMFGDPITNSKNFHRVDFIEVVKMQRGFDLPVSARNNAGKFPVYGSNGVLGFHDAYKVSNPIVIVGRSGTLGKVAACFTPCWPLNTTLFSVETHDNNIVYLKWLLKLFKLDRFSAGAGVPTLNRNSFHYEKIIDVPLTLQEEFAAFVAEVDKLEFARVNVKLYYVQQYGMLYVIQN